VVGIAAGEIDRIMTALKGAEDPPYFLSYGIVDERLRRLSASAGVVTRDVSSRQRYLDVDVRVGSPALDNTHQLLDGPWYAEEIREEIALPLDGDPYATQVILWRETDAAWRGAKRRLTQVRTNESVKVEREDAGPDFSPAEPVVFIEPLLADAIALDRAAWAARLRPLSERLLGDPAVLDAAAELTVAAESRWLVTSEGARLQFPRLHFRVSMWASAVADDGMQLQVHEAVDASTERGLPDQAALEALADSLVAQLASLREAPLLEPFTGPAILRGRAAGVFFHEVFGHRIEGHRQKNEDEGQTFRDMVGEPILPPFLSVFDDPTLAERVGVELNGSYPFDDEGVPAERVALVEGGVLKTFLLSRQPVAGLERSNGHGRRQPGNAIVPRQGNLIIEVTDPEPYADLRARLVEEITAQGKPYGLIVDDIAGGFTFTGRVIPNSFNVRPITVWRVYADGRPDEMVRGGDLIGTPLVTFSRILAAADDTAVFNGTCGAESGWVPVSASSPSLLLEEIEVQRKEKESDRPPLLPPPGAPAGDGDAGLAP